MVILAAMAVGGNAFDAATAVASLHRSEAFAAGQYVVDSIKQNGPLRREPFS
ncbi:MAG: hypothetical protein EXR53_03765 [Dehalococcoidia bacterium]|nr:hypothetical protein [Dehalococcoidia bacterium]